MSYWVSPTGAASWAAAESETPLEGSACCSLDAANQNVAAGDTVVLRGGTYTLTGGNNYDYGVSPQTTGTSGAGIITYQAHDGESPVFNSDYAVTHVGIWLLNVNYIKVDGIQCRDIQTWGTVNNSSYNEITNCTFGPASDERAQAGFGVDGGSAHNWIHGNTFQESLSSGGACEEGSDLLRIGNALSVGDVDPQNDYNTIEENVFSHAAHTCFDNYGSFNVIRNNVFHNEPWIAGCPDGQDGQPTNFDTSESSVLVGTGSKTLTISPGHTLAQYNTIGLVYNLDNSIAMSGQVTSYNDVTGELVMSVFDYGVSGEGTYNDWVVSRGNYPYYENSDYNWEYGHRCLQLTGDTQKQANRGLVENNRIGHASNNPGNGGPMNIDCAAPGNIVRLNYIYNGMSSGIYFKYADADFADGPVLSVSSVAIGTGAKSFEVASGYHFYVGQRLRISSIADKSNAMSGIVTDYTGTTLQVTTDTENGTGTFADWQFTVNGGIGGVNNAVYHNTIAHNGHGYDWGAYGHENQTYSRFGIKQANASGEGSTGNKLINNIVYDNPGGPIVAGGLNDEGDEPETWDTVTNNLTTDPAFTDPDYSDATSLVLPDLSIGPGSDALNNGSALTTTNGSGSTSSTLIVDDSTFFQDGTLGSSLSSVAGDWVAVGTTGNVSQITAIDYDTHTLTLDDALTWADEDDVWLYKDSTGTQVLYGSAPNQGAYQFNDGPVTPPNAPTDLTLTAL